MVIPAGRTPPRSSSPASTRTRRSLRAAASSATSSFLLCARAFTASVGARREIGVEDFPNAFGPVCVRATVRVSLAGHDAPEPGRHATVRRLDTVLLEIGCIVCADVRRGHQVHEQEATPPTANDLVHPVDDQLGDRALLLPTVPRPE